MNTVYGVKPSPFVRKVLIALEMKGQAYDLEIVLPFARNDSYRKINPLGKVPAYRDEYVQLADSTVICEYLEEKYPAVAVYPRSITDRAEARWIEDYADNQLAVVFGLGLFFERLVKPFMTGQPTDEAVVRQTLATAIPDTNDYLERRVPGSGFLFADGLTMADIAIGVWYQNAAYAHYRVDASRWPKLAAYIDRLLATPEFRRRIDDEREIIGQLGGNQEL